MEIENKKTSSFKKLVKTKEVAFFQLTQRQKRGEKGRAIKYTRLGMENYLLPEAKITVVVKLNFWLFDVV